jgi:hypothetical protein
MNTPEPDPSMSELEQLRQKLADQKARHATDMKRYYLKHAEERKEWQREYRKRVKEEKEFEAALAASAALAAN